MERRWNQALQRVQEIELRIEQHIQGQVKTTAPTREEFEDLAAKLEAVWDCSDTDIRLKKRIVRTLIHEVVVDVDPSAGEVILVIHWKGGAHTELRLPRRRRAQTSKEIIDTVRVLTRICSDEVITGVLNRNGLCYRFARGPRADSLRRPHLWPLRRSGPRHWHHCLLHQGRPESEFRPPVAGELLIRQRQLSCRPEQWMPWNYRNQLTQELGTGKASNAPLAFCCYFF